MTAGPQGTQNSLVAADHSVDIASPHDVTMSACKGISKTSIAADCCLYLTAAIACTVALPQAVTPLQLLLGCRHVLVGLPAAALQPRAPQRSPATCL